MDWKRESDGAKGKFLNFWNNLIHDSDRSVGFPLYRVLIGITVIPITLQLVLGRVPDSVVQATPQWYHYIFIVMQLLGVTLIMASLAMGDTPDSAAVEMVGVIFMGGMCFIYFAIAWKLDGWAVPPLAVASWMQFGFGIFCVIRIVQLHHKLEMLKARVAELQKKESS